jgi:hypothetical protein
LLIFAIILFGCYATERKNEFRENERNDSKKSADKIELEEEMSIIPTNRLLKKKIESDKKKTHNCLFGKKKSKKTQVQPFDDIFPSNEEINYPKEKNPNISFVSVRFKCKKAEEEYIDRTIKSVKTFSHDFDEHKVTNPDSKVTKVSGSSDPTLNTQGFKIEEEKKMHQEKKKKHELDNLSNVLDMFQFQQFCIY